MINEYLEIIIDGPYIQLKRLQRLSQALSLVQFQCFPSSLQQFGGGVVIDYYGIKQVVEADSEAPYVTAKFQQEKHITFKSEAQQKEVIWPC